MSFRGRSKLVPVPGGEVFVNTVNEEMPGTPLLIIPGGPGYPEDFEPLRSLNRPVVTYHQLGSGHSRFVGQEKPENDYLWTLDRSVDELHAVMKGINLRRVNLLGYSYGGMVLTESLLREYNQNRLPKGVNSVIFASTPFSEQVVTDDLHRMLGQEFVDKIIYYEDNGKTDDPEYIESIQTFTEKYILGVGFDPDQHESLRFSEATFGKNVALAMVGHSEINPKGALKGYEKRLLIHALRGLPVLITCGRMDEVTPASMEEARNLIPQAELVVFEESAHFAQWTEADKFRLVVDDFLMRTDAI